MKCTLRLKSQELPQNSIGIVSPEIGQAHFKESTTEKDRGIPEEYPDLLVNLQLFSSSWERRLCV